MKPETNNQKAHWIRAMVRELLIEDQTLTLAEKATALEDAYKVAAKTYEFTSPQTHGEEYDNSRLG
jgi:hypothetical protein|tara:strand:- start:338 stop:535 length:198 start_codon:yes stop_codon:yes gene_type:complete